MKQFFDAQQYDTGDDAIFRQWKECQMIRGERLYRDVRIPKLADINRETFF